MSRIDLSTIEPFEISSIRPPTENYSLSFRVTRNCYWNRCGYCPVYKTGMKFSKRTIDEVKRDITNAVNLDGAMHEYGLGSPYYSQDDYYKASALIDKIKKSRREAGRPLPEKKQDELPEHMDERMRWFMSWFKDKPDIEESIFHLISWRIGGARTCFIGDADSLILNPDFFGEVASHIKLNFPTVERFTIYGRTRTAAQVRSVDELKRFHEAGLNRVHFGLESGADSVLALVNKGVTAAQHIEGCLKTKESGLSCSIYVMPGLGGHKLSEENAYETARVINAIGPDYIRLRTLEIFPGTPLEAMRNDGTFTEASEEDVVREIRILVENINCDTEILSDSASNLLDINGKLPSHRELLLQNIDSYLRLSARERLEYSFSSRLNSFMGQYGSPSDDIMQALFPYISDNSIDVRVMSDLALSASIRLIRSKLMP